MTPRFNRVGIYDYWLHATSTVMMEARMARLNSKSEDKLAGQEITSS
jgi:hypothetical protein